MRPIAVSTDVFARIWALRRPGEDTEDSILRRVLNASGGGDRSESKGDPAAPGVFDKRYGVGFPCGFEIFRRFRNVDRRAVADAGFWRLAGSDERFTSLNELSKAIGAGPENAWVNWWFIDAGGERRKLDALRNPQHVARRSKSQRARIQQGLDQEDSDMATWLKDVTEVMRQLKKAPLAVIYREVRKLRIVAGRSRPASLTAVVRRTLEESSSDSDSFKGKQDLFYMPEGKGAGIWALR